MCTLVFLVMRCRFGGKSGVAALIAHNAILNPNEHVLASKLNITNMVKALHDAVVCACIPSIQSTHAPPTAVSPDAHPCARTENKTPWNNFGKTFTTRLVVNKRGVARGLSLSRAMLSTAPVSSCGARHAAHWPQKTVRSPSLDSALRTCHDGSCKCWKVRRPPYS